MRPHRLGLAFTSLSMGFFFLGSLPATSSAVPVLKMSKAHAYEGKAATQNVCGAHCRRPGEPNFRLPGHDGHVFLLYMVNTEPAPAPWLVGVQEVCAMQGAWLAFNMASGYSHDFTYTKYYDEGCSGQYGNHMATVGPHAGGIEVLTYLASTYSGGTVPAEARRIQCRNKQGWGFGWRACNTHLVPTNAGSPTEQAAFARVMGGNGSVIAVGDFNIPNATNPTSTWHWPVIWEVDSTNRRFTALLEHVMDSTVESKIDYIFRNSAWLPGHSARTSCQTVQHRLNTAAFTDHCYLSARLWN